MYTGKWIDSFNARVIEEKDIPSIHGKILLETPNYDYVFSKEQWREFKEKINKV